MQSTRPLPAWLGPAVLLLGALLLLLLGARSASAPPASSSAGASSAGSRLDGQSALPSAAASQSSAQFVAKRTSCRPYNEYLPNQRYVVYSPSGGLNNQREELEAAMQIAVLLNRTLYVPMAARHTSSWQRYAGLTVEQNDLVAFDLVADFAYMEGFDAGVRLVPLNTSLPRFVSGFVKAHGPGSTAMVSPKRMKRGDVEKLAADRHPLIYLHGPGMYHEWFATSTMVKVRRRMRFAPHMREMALRVVQQKFPTGFYALHIRMGDSRDRLAETGAPFVSMARDQKWSMRQFPTYVATEPTREAEFFAPVERALKVTYSDGLDPDLIRAFKSAFPRGVIRVDMMGVLEQLICTQAKRFIGTRTSTFSAYIVFMRKFPDEAFPEMAPTSQEDRDQEGASVDLGPAAGGGEADE